MMLIQIILIIAILCLGIYFVKSRNASKTKAYKKILLLLSIPIAITIVMFPSLATEIAQLLGVGRGADLLLYGVTVGFIFQLFNTYIKDREAQRRFVILSRKVAILEARLNKLK